MSRAWRYFSAHPRLSRWLVLSAGMVVVLLLTAPNDGLTTGQLAGLAAACVALAGACSWIIGWEERPDDDDDSTPRPTERDSEDD